MQAIQQYGICSWLGYQNEKNILLGNNAEQFNALMPNQKVFNIYAYPENSAYWIISYGKQSFIILKEAIKIVNIEVLEIGCMVQEKNNSDRIGSIAERRWHFKENSVCYYITINDKLFKKRYFREDLLRYL